MRASSLRVLFPLFAVSLGSGCDGGGGGKGAGAGGDGIGGSGAAAGTATGGAGAAGSGGTSNAGEGTVAGAPSAGAGGAVTAPALPVPPGDDRPRPAGTAGNLKVLSWAGFKAAVSYSFDDSLSSQLAHYAELQATGVRMTFYVVCNNLRAADWQRVVTDGHEIGNHTAHHCQDDGTGCGGVYAGSLEAEFDVCTEQITTELGVTPYTSASPFGDAGYVTAAQGRFFINRGVAGGQIAPNGATNPLSIPCHGAVAGETADGFNAAIDSARSSGRWQVMLIHSLGGDGGFAPIAAEELVASVEHAKAAGDVWIDSVVNVGAYWVAEKLVSSAPPATSGDQTTWTWTLPERFPPGRILRVTVDGGTLSQNGAPLEWDAHGYYEVALDAGSLTLAP